MEDWRDKLAQLKNQGDKKQTKKQEEVMPEKIEFFNKDGTIRAELLDEEAREWAVRFIEPPSEGRSRRNGLTSAQLRKFYNEVKALEAKLKANNYENYSEVYPFIRMLKSKASYACPKWGRKKVPEEFKDFIHLMVNSIPPDKENGLKNFDAFLRVFEAVVGYFYGEGGRQQ